MAVFRFEHHHLEDLVALLLAAGEALVDGAGGELAVHFQQVHFRVEILVVGDGVDFLALGQAGLEGGADEVGVARRRGFRMGYWKARKRPARERSSIDISRDILAVEGDGAAGDGVAFVAGDDLARGCICRSRWGP